MRTIVSILLTALLAAVLAAPATAGEVEKSVPFELEKWHELEVTDGPLTLHRIRVTELSGVKSTIFRPGNSEYLTDVQVQIEYSNPSEDDVEADVEIHWLDAQGRIIDGYDDEEDFDDEERHEEQTITLSTLKYGLEVADTLRFTIRW